MNARHSIGQVYDSKLSDLAGVTICGEGKAVSPGVLTVDGCFNAKLELSVL